MSPAADLVSALIDGPLAGVASRVHHDFAGGNEPIRVSSMYGIGGIFRFKKMPTPPWRILDPQ